ncbi:hypothetical protein GRI97_17485 [Altererythrobacter xixiisoli]|uniref:Uncharacterized protein n=1 Tax=Croceibacterium xixiisoli TaxID=1476466 RepID=A0A6I4TXN1_9SPHN|nr:hypothetical protein [Croceibacterium xixiisoli]MXP00787.1 hypothetical protein [Croceibacterium xixiisoli]
MHLLADPRILVLAGIGCLIALVEWLLPALRRLPLSLPIVCIRIGAVVFLRQQVKPRPSRSLPQTTERFAELVVIILLMSDHNPLASLSSESGSKPRRQSV